MLRDNFQEHAEASGRRCLTNAVNCKVVCFGDGFEKCLGIGVVVKPFVWDAEVVFGIKDNKRC